MNVPVIRIAAAAIRGRNGKVLLVRKKGARAFMQPGGKIEEGESARDALCRELQEEIGLAVPKSTIRPLGRYHALAANEADVLVDAELFELPCECDVWCGAEIAERRWVDPAHPDDLPLAPLTRDTVLPLMARKCEREPEMA